MSAIGRLIRRINRWLEPTAVGSAVEPSGGSLGGGSTNFVAANAVLGEIEEKAAAEPEPEEESKAS